MWSLNLTMMRLWSIVRWRGSWTLSKAKLSEVGTRAKDGSYPERNVKCCVRKGYLYVPSYDKKGVYKINTANSADVTLIPLGFTSKLKSLGEAGSCEVYMILLGDMILAGDFQITADDRVIKTQGSARFEAMATPLFQYKNFVFMWVGSYGKEHRCAYLLTPYLASINNLSSAVVKNPKFEEAILNKIGSRIDTEEIEKEIEGLEKQHRQLTGAKGRLGQQMDSLDIMDKFYEKKY